MKKKVPFKFKKKKKKRNFGKVFKGMQKVYGQIVAIKLVTIDSEENPSGPDSLVKEIGTLMKCSSPFVTAYYGSYVFDLDFWVRDPPHDRTLF